MTDHASIKQASLGITGLGLVSPLGHSAWDTFSALLEGRCLTDRAAEYPVEAASHDPVNFVRAMGCCSFSQHSATDPAIELAERAAREALTMAGVHENHWPDIPCYLGVSKGAMHAWQRELTRHHHLIRISQTGPTTSSSTANNLSPTTLGPVGYLAAHLRNRLNIGPIYPVMGACASSLIALHLARLAMLSSSIAAPKRVLVLTSEAALLPLFIHSYKRLGVLPALSPGEYVGLPLDESRRGFMLSELAAAVVLESPAGSHQNPGIAMPELCKKNIPMPGLYDVETGVLGRSKAGGKLQLINTAIAAEGYDLMQPAPHMHALAQVVRTLATHRNIDVLHPHATGTPENDLLEMALYEREIAQARGTPAYACKGALGHGLGAAGLVSLVLACLCARTGRIPPMPWLSQPIDTRFELHRTPQTIPANTTHAIYAAGFGGHVAGAVIRYGA